MRNVVTFGFSEDFLKEIAGFIEENYIKPKKDLSRVAIVFGGTRPRLFLQKELAQRIKKPFLPPKFFSMDEFIEYLLSKNDPIAPFLDFEACFAIYRHALKNATLVLKERKSFAQFLPWAREILSFIEQLDLEAIEIKSLKDIQNNAAIGYDVPASINDLLENIVNLRHAFHEDLKKRASYTRGFKYLTASRLIETVEFKEFDSILFCGFFYLHKTEERIIKKLTQDQKAQLFFQGDQKDWSVLDRASKVFECKIEPLKDSHPQYDIVINSGFDLHSQVCHVREILKNVKDTDKTVIVLPDPESMVPLLSEIAGMLKNFNISIGYPIKRSSMYSLFECLFRSQETRKADTYYVRDYLRLLGHPLIKNLALVDGADVSVTRILVHKIEEVLLGMEKTALGGSLFVRLDDIENEKAIYESAFETMRHMDVKADSKDLNAFVKFLHKFLFKDWEDVHNFQEFSVLLTGFLDVLLDKSFLDKYPMNLKVVGSMVKVAEEFASATFNREKFRQEDIFKIFKDKLENEMVSFSGSPLKGLQILGFLETRSLNFDNVFILDVNESVLPKLKIYEPLIPRDVSLSLGLNRLEKEEEIQRYQFMRLLSGAKHVYLFYQESAEKEKSRFVEGLIWQKQKALNRLEGLKVCGSRFALKSAPQEIFVAKRPLHVSFLENFRYSATSVDTYLRCPLRFYYSYVLGLKEKETLLDEPEAKDLGVFIHNFLEETFKKFIGLAPRIDAKFEEYFFKILEERFEEDFARKMKSDAFLVKEVLDLRLARFLENERLRDVKELVCVEHVVEDKINLLGRDFSFKAKIDRIDRLFDNSLLIIDYKTGISDIMPADVRRIEAGGFSREALKKTVKSFQLPLYYYLVERGEKNVKMNAVLYNIRNPEKDFGPYRLFKDEEDPVSRNKRMEVCMKALEGMFGEMLDLKTSFKADEEDSRYCSMCPFFYLCR
jgi:CRISPR/Cas system-associated exonuclease Cas4 (RecB family)